MRKIKTEDFIKKAKEVHGDKYDYSQVEYKNAKTNIKFNCQIHGVFEQLPSVHLRGGGCPKCGGRVKHTTEEFISKAKEVHEDKYDYSLVEYVNNSIKVKIICNLHGIFEQRPSKHLLGTGCPKCAGKNKTTEYFTRQAKQIHGDKYDYSQVEYVNNSTKVRIICPIHGVFEQTTSDHLSGKGCPKCGGSIKLTTEEFIEKSKEIHGDKYNYSLVEYINNKTKVKIICPIHGVFEQQAGSHLQGNSCPKCTGRNKTTEEFIEKSKEIHGDKYDYSQVEYINTTTKVKIICPIHGVFEQQAGSHLRGCICPKCSGHFLDCEYFIKRSKDIHGNKYDYSLVEYKGGRDKVKIICPIHGVFEQSPDSHLRASGCPKCVGRNKTTEEFIKKAKEIHGNKYDYLQVEYINTKTKVKIICPKHGMFEQTPASHLNGNGCPVCNVGFTSSFKLSLLTEILVDDLLLMEPSELMALIKEGALPSEFSKLAGSMPNTNERTSSIQKLKDLIEKDGDDSLTTIATDDTEFISDEESTLNDEELDTILNGDLTNANKNNEVLPSLDATLLSLHLLDNAVLQGLSEETVNFLIEFKLRKLWNQIINKDITYDAIVKEQGSTYFEQLKSIFIEEYNEALSIEPKPGYNFRINGELVLPNDMQKLTVYRLVKNRCYGNWSGVGAGKTNSFILASREIDARLTVVIGVNSTIDQLGRDILRVYPDSNIYTEYEPGMKFDMDKYNYLILNYEKFQLGYSESLYQDLTTNNKIDFIVLDEVHNAKARTEDEESIRRGVLMRLIGRGKDNNDNMHVLAMSATPVINNIYEAKSLLTMITGKDYSEISNRATLPNAMEIYKHLVLNGLRYIPKYNIEIEEITGENNEILHINGKHLIDDLIACPKGNVLKIEQLLIEDKLKVLYANGYIRKGVIMYSYFTDGIISETQKFLADKGFTVCEFTGSNKGDLLKFIDGKYDILLASKPIATGVDGLQRVCNRAILLTLPWTDSEYTQFKGRIYRQGSIFNKVQFIIPQIFINIEDEPEWSWDKDRWFIIKNKKTLADACVDGVIPEDVITKSQLFNKAIKSLTNIKEKHQFKEGERADISIDLYPEITDEYIKRDRIESELSEYNRKGKTTTSRTMHDHFTKNKEDWFRYHQLRDNSTKDWSEIPYEYIAKQITSSRKIVADFGCGMNKMKDCIPYNRVYSFDHVSCDESVIACDISDVSKYLDNNTIDVAVFSLSLWGTNWRDYIKEAYRVLDDKGVIWICEPSNEMKDLTKNINKTTVDSCLTENGFTIINTEDRGKFTYVQAIKM